MRSTPPTNLDQLEEALSRPPPAAVESLAQSPGDLLLVGVGGKMGPSLARMARRATEEAGLSRRIIGVSRFSTPGLEDQLRAWDIETVRCDLFDETAVAGLPLAENVLCMLGFKFGTGQAAARTWATNTYLPALLSRRFSQSRLVAFSTGNVYPLVPSPSAGCSEQDPLGPVGEYGMSALGRERIFEFFSDTAGTPMTLLRLNYACELRYGVLVDIASRVWASQPVPLEMGYFNVIWQGDANAYALQSFGTASSPPAILNMTGPEVLSVKEVAEEFSRLLNKPVGFNGQPAGTALLNNPARMLAQFGPPRVPAAKLITWIADWLQRGGETWNKPTHFEVRDGRF